MRRTHLASLVLASLALAWTAPEGVLVADDARSDESAAKDADGSADPSSAVEPARPARVLDLWPGKAPGETAEIGEEHLLPEQPNARKVQRLANVSTPSLSVYPAPVESANGAAVLVCPGGGYHILAWDLEGTEIAAWLNSIGVTAVVLKYRVPRREGRPPHAAPLQDAQRAMRLVRKHAEDWRIDPKRVGVLGFSAGGHLSVVLANNPDLATYPPADDADRLSARPDFCIPIYPAYLVDPNETTRIPELVAPSEQTPPTFLAVTADDAERGAGAAEYFAALWRAKVPAEIHVWERGGHGYGLRASSDRVSTWPEHCAAWMRARGLLER